MKLLMVHSYLQPHWTNPAFPWWHHGTLQPAWVSQQHSTEDGRIIFTSIVAANLAFTTSWPHEFLSLFACYTFGCLVLSLEVAVGPFPNLVFFFTGITLCILFQCLHCLYACDLFVVTLIVLGRDINDELNYSS